MQTITFRNDLGFTRVAGYTIFDSETKQFNEMTPREVALLIKNTQINGLKLTEAGEIILDTEGFNIKNLKIKSGIGKYRNMYSCEYGDNKFYAVVRLIHTDNGKLYEIIDNKCARIKLDEAKLLALATFNLIAGIRIINGNIQLCDGVIYEDKRSELKDFDFDTIVNGEEIVDFNGSLISLNDLKALAKSNDEVEDQAENKTMEEIFNLNDNQGFEEIKEIKKIDVDNQKDKKTKVNRH